MDSATLASQITDYDKNRVTSTDALNGALASYGVPELRKGVADWRTTISNTKNALNAVDPSVTGRTSQSLVTEAQRSRMVNNERAPIAEQLTTQNDAYGLANSDLKDATDRATMDATNKVNDWQTGRNNLQGQYEQTYKREQDTASSRRADEAARIAREDNDRNYALAVQAASSKGSAAAAKNPGQVKLEVGQYVAGQLSNSVGKDGKVSNQTWSAALNDAVASGFTVREFWQKFGQYVNTKYKASYAGHGQR